MFVVHSEPVVGSGDGSSSGLSEDEQEGEEHREENVAHSDPELILTCFVLMLDIVYKQVYMHNFFFLHFFFFFF